MKTCFSELLWLLNFLTVYHKSLGNPLKNLCRISTHFLQPPAWSRKMVTNHLGCYCYRGGFLTACCTTPIPYIDVCFSKPGSFFSVPTASLSAAVYKKSSPPPRSPFIYRTVSGGIHLCHAKWPLTSKWPLQYRLYSGLSPPTQVDPGAHGSKSPQWSIGSSMNGFSLYHSALPSNDVLMASAPHRPILAHHVSALEIQIIVPSPVLVGMLHSLDGTPPIYLQQCVGPPT